MSDGKTDAKYKNEIKRDTKNGANVSAKLNTGSASQQKTCTCEKLMEKSEAAKNGLLGPIQKALPLEKQKLMSLKHLMPRGVAKRAPTAMNPWVQQRKTVYALENLESELQSAAPHTFLKGEEAAKLYNCETILSDIGEATERANDLSLMEKSLADIDNFFNKDQIVKSNQRQLFLLKKYLNDNTAAYCSVIEVSGKEVDAMMYDGRSAAEALVIGFIPWIGTVDALAETSAYWATGRYGNAILASIGAVPAIGKPIGKGIRGLSRFGKSSMTSARANAIMERAKSLMLGKKKPPNTNPPEGKPTTPKLEEGDSKVGGTKSGVAKVCKKCG